MTKTCTDRNNDDDPDVDWLPTGADPEIERELGKPYHPPDGYDPTQPASVDNHLGYGEGWRDCEDYAMHRQTGWENGSANSVDWANPGKQY